MSDPRIVQNGADTSESLSLGLAANGSAGPWYVDVDETTAGPQRWFVQVEGPSVDLSFEIASPAAVEDALNFLQRGSDPSLPLGGSRQAPVNLIRDDEYPDRFFVVVGTSPEPVVRFTLTGDDLANLIEALRQARDDLQ
jgi:hypothetical protein